MALVTLRVLDGADRGRIYQKLPTPITIGREEGNSIQLNDERVSRFHIKIQEDQGKLVLTDLESTNGTRVNGEPVRLWILRHGDVVALGRTVLICGTREEIAQRLANLRSVDREAGITLEADELDAASSSVSLEFEVHFNEDADAQSILHTLMPPTIPDELSPAQAAQLYELIQFIHLRLRGLIDSVQIVPDSERVTLETQQWQNLLDMQSRLAEYLCAIGEPEEE